MKWPAPRVAGAPWLCLTLALSGAAQRAEEPAELAVRRLLGAGRHGDAIAAARQAVERSASQATLEALVDAYQAAGRLADAAVDLDGRLRARPGDAWLHFARGLLDAREGRYAEALPRLRRAIELEPGSAPAQRELAFVLYKLDRLDEARAGLQQRLAANTRDAVAHYALGFVHNFDKDAAAALQHLERAAALDPGLLDAYRYASQIHLGNGDFRAALEMAGRLAARAEQDPMLRAVALNTMGNASVRLARYAQAVTYFEEALAAQRELGSRQGQWSTLNGLGVMCDSLGESDRARAYHQQALRLVESPADARWKATTLHNLGVSYALQGRPAPARRYLQRALRLREELGRAGDLAYTLAEIGASHARQGDFASGLRYLDRAAAQAAVTEDAHLRLVVEIALAESHERRGVQAEAEERYARALRAAARIRHRESEWRAERGLGALRLQAGDLEAARGHYARAVATIEGIRHEVHDQAARTVFLAGKTAAYEGMVETLHRLHRRAPQAGHESEAFAYAQRAKARAFLELLSQARADLGAGATRDGRETEREALAEVARAERALERAGLAPDSRGKLEARLRQAQRRVGASSHDARRRDPEFAALRFPEPEPLERVQSQLLGGDTLLLEFMLGDERSFAWLVSAERIEMAALPGRRALEARIERYRRAVALPPLEAETAGAAMTQGRELYRLLLAPFASRVHSARRLVVVPDGALHFLPFETLVAGVRSGRPRYVLEAADVTYAPSASVLARLRKEPAAAPLALLAYGAPALGRRAAADDARDASAGAPWASRGRASPAPLPHARAEVEAIAAHFPAGSRRVRLGRAASESALKRENLALFRVLHLATHGVVDERAPGRAGLLLAPGDAGEDGVLHAAEILDLELDADLVVLSACGTGLGRLVRGEGLLGLSRAFFHAGARSLVVSLWDVDDASTADVMQRFYRRLSSGAPRAAALREAKLDLLRSDRPLYRHPYYWAPLVLLGHGS